MLDRKTIDSQHCIVFWFPDRNDSLRDERGARIGGKQGIIPPTPPSPPPHRPFPIISSALHITNTQL